LRCVIKIDHSYEAGFPFYFFLNCACAYSQGESNNWYFGDRAGITFNLGAPISLTDGVLNTLEGCSTISDPNGNLLFYTDGTTVYDRTHNVMPNGTGLLADTSASQSAMIIPQPGSLDIFYIFTIDNLNGYGLHFSVVDLSLNGGLGDVTNRKNVLLHTPSTEKITAVRHANGTDIWIVSQKASTGQFFNYLIDNNGINLSGVVSIVGLISTWSSGNPLDDIGYMKSSPDASKLACVYNGSQLLELFDFDSTTGTVTNPIQIDVFSTLGVSTRPYGLEFAPNSRYLYVSETGNSIYQFDLDVFDEPSITASLIEINSIQSGSLLVNEPHAALQLGPDGKIYVAHFNHNYLGVINNPNLQGNACNYEFDGVFLSSGVAKYGLPPIIPRFSFFRIEADGFCLGDSTTFEIINGQNINSITWDFGDGSSSNQLNPSHNYSTSGNYTVTVTITTSTEIVSDSLDIRIINTPLAINPPSLIECDENNDGSAVFDLSEQDSTIRNGQSMQDYHVSYFEDQNEANLSLNELPDNYTNSSNPQTIYYRIESVNDSDCYATGSFELVVYESPQLNIDSNYSYCEGEDVLLTADSGFDSYLWSTGETTPSIIVNSSGNYTVSVVSDYGNVTCETSISVVVAEIVKPIIANVVVNDWSLNNNTIRIEAHGVAPFQYSIDGNNFQTSNEFENLSTGEYTIYVRDANDCGVAVQQIFLLFYPRFFTPNGDGFNDFWQVFNAAQEPLNRIYIYDRFGKLLYQIDPIGIGWDGTYNGNPLPASDYWFVVERLNGKTHRGHFTLKR